MTLVYIDCMGYVEWQVSFPAKCSETGRKVLGIIRKKRQLVKRKLF